MKIAYSMLVSCAVALAGGVSMASAQGTVGHKMLSPQEIKWASTPPSVPPGAEAVVLYGDPSKDEMFALRLNYPSQAVGHHRGTFCLRRRRPVVQLNGTGPCTLNYLNPADDPGRTRTRGANQFTRRRRGWTIRREHWLLLSIRQLVALFAPGITEPGFALAN